MRLPPALFANSADKMFELQVISVVMMVTTSPTPASVCSLNVSVHAARMGMAQLIEDCLPSLRHAQAQLKLVL